MSSFFTDVIGSSISRVILSLNIMSPFGLNNMTENMMLMSTSVSNGVVGTMSVTSSSTTSVVTSSNQNNSSSVSSGADISAPVISPATTSEERKSVDDVV